MGFAVCSAVLALASAGAVPTEGSDPPAGRGQVVAQPFEVPATSEPKYGVQPPSVDPERQIRQLTTDDGEELYIETWLPAAADGHVPPARLPTVLLATPYHGPGEEGASYELLEPLVTRGYAYSRVHLRGTGASSGCLSMLDERDAQDVALAIEYVGRDAPWFDGRVGLSGLSWQGGAALNAVLRGDPDRTRYVQAVEVAAPTLSAYEGVMAHDGVPQLISGQGVVPNVTAAGIGDAVAGGSVRAELADRVGCLPEHAVAGAGLADGSKSPYYEARDMRSAVAELDVPLLLFHGYEDFDPFGVLPIVQAGFFDRLPDDVPHVGVFGVWQHEYPLGSGSPYSDLRLDIRRADSERLRIAWFDHFLRDIDAGVDHWPQVQVQTTDGLWRVLDRWPSPVGTPGQLSLGPEGVLGTGEPTGASTYLEGPAELKAAAVPGAAAAFVTPPLPDRLELSGVAVTDLWLVLEQPDAHVVVTLEALDEHGEPIAGARTYGSRSAQHLDPILHGRFTQADPEPAPTGEALQVRVRLNPTQLAVPIGGRLRLTVTGMANTTEGIGAMGLPDPVVGQGTQPSGVVQTVTVLHNCAHPSALRFTMPDRDDFFTVAQLDPNDRTRTTEPTRMRFTRPSVDGGGLATAPVCGRTPGHRGMAAHPQGS